MKVLSLEEIENRLGTITYTSLDARDAQNYFNRLLHTAREYHRLREALEWIAGKSDKPYCTYYERTLDDGTAVPTVGEIAEQALKESEGE